MICNGVYSRILVAKEVRMPIVTPGQLWLEHSEQQLLKEPKLIELKNKMVEDINQLLRDKSVIYRVVQVVIPLDTPSKIVDALRCELGSAGYWVVDAGTSDEGLLWDVTCKH